MVLACPIQVCCSLRNGDGLSTTKAGHHPIDTDKALPLFTVDEDILFTAVQTLTKMVAGMREISRIRDHKPSQCRVGVECIQHAAGNNIELLLGKPLPFFTNSCHSASPLHDNAGDCPPPGF